MNIENVHAVGRACAAWGQADMSILREVYAPDVVAEGGTLWPEGAGRVQGREAIIQTFEGLIAPFEHSEVIPDSVIEAEDLVILLMLWRGVFQGSHAAIEQRLVGAFHFRDGLIVFIAWHAELEPALDAAGLPRSAVERLMPFADALAGSPTSEQVSPRKRPGKPPGR
jgi:ketosteroid isomerase-like protein